MSTTQQVITKSVEYIEFAVKNLEVSSKLFEAMAFQCVGKRSENSRKSKLYKQGDAYFVLSTSSDDKDPVFQFTQKHGDGVLRVAYGVDNPEESWNIATTRGAVSAEKPVALETSGKSAMHKAAIHVYGDVLNEFVKVNKGHLDDFFPEEKNPLTGHKGRMMQTIDHVTVNVGKGEMDKWADFYEDVFGFHKVRYFDIRTERTGLLSRAIRNQNGRVTMPFNEPTNEKSQIQEFVDTFHGPGVQHIALHTPSILTTLPELIAKGFKFLNVPSTYYDAVPSRVPNVAEDMKELEKLGILIDGSKDGYLLQIFTEPVIGPFFFEVIQRKGDNGFGDGNFRALFEAMERDQIKRGVL